MKQLLVTTLALAGVCLAQGSIEKGNGAIGGIVRSATTGEPIQSARILLSLGAVSGTFRRPGATDGGGRFLFTNLPAGRYKVQFTKAGYRRSGNRLGDVTLREDQKVTDLDIRLLPGGVITGRVLDPEGEPVYQAQVQLHAIAYRDGESIMTRAGQVRTDDRGMYRLYGLRAGKYILSAWPPARGTPAGELYAGTTVAYFPAAPTPSGALPVRMTWGQELAKAEIRLSDRPTFSVIGAAVDATRAEPCSDCVIFIARVDGAYFERLPITARTSSEGVFVLQGLGSGFYKIVCRKGSRGAVAQQTVEIRHEDLADVVLTLGSGQTSSGTVVLEDPPDAINIGRLTVAISPVQALSFWPVRDGDVESDGRFQLREVPAERYQFEVIGLPAGAYLKALRIGKQLLARPQVSATEDAPLTDIEAVIAFDGATVIGKVTARRSEGAATRTIAARVSLIPKPNHAAYLTRETVEAESDGRFRFATVVPGAYTLYALPAMTSVQIFDPAVQASLRGFARPVDLKPEESVAVEVPLTPGSD